MQKAITDALKRKLGGSGGTGRSVALLVGGVAFAQAVGVVALPLLTRFYTPAHFEGLALFASAISVLSVSAALRLELALPLPEEDSDAANILALALIVGTLTSICLAISLWSFSDYLARVISTELRPYLWLIPVGTWLTSVNTTLQFWATRKTQFKAIAHTRATQALGGITVQLGCGIAKFAPLGLLLGQVVTNGAGLVSLGLNAYRRDSHLLAKISRSAMKTLFLRYQRFPKYSTLEALANTASIQLPVLLIAAMAAGHEAGYILLATRALGLPTTVIGAAVSQVYLSRAPEEMRSGTLGAFTGITLCRLAKTGAGPLIFLGMISPTLFPLVFGASWHRAGELAAWMTGWYVMQYVTTPVSMALHILDKQRTALLLQLLGTVLRVSAVLVGAHFDMAAEAYALSGFVFYLCYFITLVILCGVTVEKSEIRRCAAHILLWTTTGLAACAAQHYAFRTP